MTKSDELIVVSGASTGMGAATAAELARRGYTVLAGVRRDEDADAIRATRVEPVRFDITDAASLESLRLCVQADGRPLRALVNNAGIAVNSPVETLPLPDWRHQFEVNVFGHVAATQALLPALRASRGRVVNIGSLGGRIALAGFGAYAGTKFALEAVSDALRREVADQGVQVVVVQPGGVRTRMVDSGGATAQRLLDGMSTDQRERYGDLMVAIMRHAEAFTAAGVDAEHAAKVIANATTTLRPRTRYTIGRDAAVNTRLSRILPDRVLDAVLRRELAKHLPSRA